MDLISHGLIGSMVAGMGIKKKFGLIASAAMIMGNLAPDFDGIVALKGAKTFYKYHREATHSLLGASVISLLLTAGIVLLTPFKEFFTTLAIVSAGIGIHLLMDSFTPWGLPLLYPFSNRKFSFNLIWFIDPAIIGSITLATLVSWRFPRFNSLTTMGAFGFMLVYLALRFIQRRKAKNIVCEKLPGGYEGAKVWVLPSAVSPFLWDVILNNRGQYLYTCVDTRCQEIIKRKEYASPAYHRCVASSQESELVEVFLKRSRFPFYNISKEGGTYIVEWLDVHLMQLIGVQGVRVAVDKETGDILEEKLEVNKPQRRRRVA